MRSNTCEKLGKEENWEDILLEAIDIQNPSEGRDGDGKGNPEKGATGKESKWLKSRTFWRALKGDDPDGNSFKLFTFIQSKNTTLRNVVLAASTFGIERLLNAKAFNCPEKGYRQYGFAFLFAPVVILFCVNLLVIGEIWKLSSRMFVKRYRRRGDCVARVLPSLLKACVGPAVWLIVAFLEEDYYICAKLGPFTPRNETNNGTSQQEIVTGEKKFKQCKSESQIIAWVVFVALFVAGTAIIVWKKCYFKDKLLMENHFAFERREALSAKIEFLKYARGDIPEHNDPNTETRDIEEGKPAAGDIRKENEPQIAAKNGSEEGKPIGRATSEDKEDTDPNIAKYGNKEEKVTLHHKGVPELIGKKTVEKLFAGYKGEDWKEDDEWHYIKAYKAFKEMYPRISSGSPLDPWRRVQGDVEGSQKAGRSIFLPKRCQKTSSAADELKPMYADSKDPQLYKEGKKQKKNKDGSVVLPVAGSLSEGEESIAYS